VTLHRAANLIGIYIFISIRYQIHDVIY